MDVTGISPSVCMYKVLMKESYKPSVQPQCRLNLAIKEVVRKEVLKLLDGDMIYAIFDSSWVNSVQVVSRKGPSQ